MVTETTEKFCKGVIHNAVLSGIKILDGKDKKQTEHNTTYFIRRISSII